MRSYGHSAASGGRRSALLLAGNAVAIDGWVQYEPSLKGSVSADKRQLTMLKARLTL